MDPLHSITRLKNSLLARCAIPRDLAEVTSIGEEEPLQGMGIRRAAIDAVWRRAEDFYRTGLHPALQICIRRSGAISQIPAAMEKSGVDEGNRTPDLRNHNPAL